MVDEALLEAGFFIVGALEGGGFGEAGIGEEVAAHLAEVFLVVGGDVDEAAGFEGAEEVAGEGLAEEAVFVVAALGPGIGEKEVDGSEAAVGQKGGKTAPGFHAQHGEVGKAGGLGLSVYPAHAIHHALDADVADMGVFCRAGHEEMAVAAAYFELGGGAGRHNGIEIKAFLIKADLDDPGWVFCLHGETS